MFSPVDGLAHKAYAVNLDIQESSEPSAFATLAPDLIIQNITWLPKNPSIGDMVTFSTTIKNQGDDESSTCLVAYYLDNTYLDTDPLNPIGAGATVTKTFTWTAIAGSHVIKAIADPDNEVVESDETNNEETFVFSTLAPDLLIQSITWSPEDPSKGDAVTFTVTIKNQGNASARSSQFAFYIDGAFRGDHDIPAIGAGATTTRTFAWNAKAGSHPVKAIADSNLAVAENDEANNEKTVTFFTLAPDLIIQNITWLPKNPSEDDDVTFTVVIKNQGSGNADYSHVAYYIDDVYLETSSVSPIDTGDSSNTSFVWTARAGASNIKALADSNTWLVESDENNNEKTITFSTLAPDLFIQGISWSPANASVGDTITLTVTIENQGRGRAAPSRVTCYISGSPTDYRDIPEIDAGATLTETFSWKALEVSNVIKVNIDTNETVAESDESNNEEMVTFSLLTPDLTIYDITWLPEDPMNGDDVTFTVTVKNKGGGRADHSYVAYYVDDTYLATAFTGLIEPGASENVTFAWKAQLGSHAIKAVANFNEQVTEGNYNNNEKTVTFSPLTPDLIVKTIAWSPVAQTEGNPITFAITIENQGNGTAGPSRVSYYIDGSFRGYHEVQELDAGATVTKTFTWAAESGSHALEVTVDSENQVIEIDENNVKTLYLPPPDLSIQEVTFSPEDAVVGEVVTFTVTIENRGVAKADASRLAYYVDGIPAGYQEVPGIDAGAAVTETFTWEAAAGSHEIKVIADVTNYVIESEETNNERVIPFSTLAPDLVIQNITWALGNSPEGVEATFTVTIENKGSGKAGASRVAYFIDDSSEGYQDLPEIDAGAAITETFTSIVGAGPHTFKAVADADKQVIEISGNNNDKEVTFSTLAPDLIIKDITWSPLGALPGEEVTFTIAIKNQGKDKADPTRLAYYIDNAPAEYLDIEELDTGTTVRKTFTWLAQEGSQIIRVVADFDKLVIETDETNNEESRTLSDTEAPKSSIRDTAIVNPSDNELLEKYWWWLFLAAAVITATAVLAIVRTLKKS